jgi:hypothetical protein
MAEVLMLIKVSSSGQDHADQAKSKDGNLATDIPVTGIHYCFHGLF